MPDPIPAAGDNGQGTPPPAGGTPPPQAGSSPPPAAPPPTGGAGWGDNWRQFVAGTDEKRLGQLQRFTSPQAFTDAFFAAQDRIRSGEARAPLPENPTPEQLTAYRQQNGIPEKAEGYFEKLPDGLVIGDEDKPLFSSFAEGLHKLNADPKIAHYAVGWYNKFQEEQAAKLGEADLTHKTEVEDALRQEWGNDYRANINHITSFLSQAPKGVAELLMNARGTDGRAIMNDLSTVRWFAQMAREANPLGTIVPAGGGGAQGIDDEIKQIEDFMRTNRSEYNKDEKKQARLRDLYDARERFKKAG